MFYVGSILLAIAIVVIFRFLNIENKPPTLGIYQRPAKTYWFKFAFMYVVLNFKQLAEYVKRLSVEKRESGDPLVNIHKNDEFLEEVHSLSNFPYAVDAVYFNGLSKSGDAVLCNVARRQNGVCDAFFMLKLEGRNLFLSPSLPDTSLEQTESEKGQYKVAGISLSKVVPMRAWKIEYDGELRSRSDPLKKVSAKVDLTWSAPFEHFNFDALSPRSLSKDIAREAWSLDYFALLERFHQHHYEQAGVLQGKATIDGKEYELNMPCVRDHTFGYYCRARDRTVFAVDWSDFQLYQHGENQVMPKEYGFSFSYDGKTQVVQVIVDDEESFYIGKQREAKFYERWSRCEVDGMNGWGCSEWFYNNQGNSKTD